MTEPTPFWTPEREQRLRQLWARGVPTPKIAAELGTTKNAVIGRANRMGLCIHPLMTGRSPEILKRAAVKRDAALAEAAKWDTLIRKRLERVS
jgi:hypothetical protein